MKSIITFFLCLTAALGWSLPLQGYHAAVARKKAAGGGGGSEPDDIANLTMWLKSDSIAAADNESLGGVTWQDSHTSNNDMVLGGGVTLQTLEINTKPCVRFGAAAYGESALSLNAPYTIIVVEKSTTNSDSRTVSSLENNRLISNGRDTIQGFVGGIVASGSQNTAWTWSALVVPASGNCKFFQGGVNETTGSITADNWGTVYMGGGFNSELPFSDVAEVIIYSAALSDSEVTTTIGGYITTRYGL